MDRKKIIIEFLDALLEIQCVLENETISKEEKQKAVDEAARKAKERIARSTASPWN